MTEFIYLFGLAFPKPVRVIDTTTYKSSRGHISWQVEDEHGNTYIVSPSELKEI